MQKWEYLFVVGYMARNDWRPVYTNGVKVSEKWEKGPTIYEFANQLGEEGWELVNQIVQDERFGDAKGYRMAFKRPKKQP